MIQSQLSSSDKQGAGPGPTTHHSSDAELFKALFLFGSHIPTAGIDTIATLRGKSGLENNKIQQSEPLRQQMGHRSSSVKALPIRVTNTVMCHAGENVSPNPLVKGLNHSEPQLTNIGRSSSFLSSKTTHEAKKKATTTLVTKLRNEQQLNTKSSSTSKVPEGVEYALEVFYKILQDIPKSGRQSVRALRKMQAKYSHLFSYPQGKVGSLPEVEVGKKVNWRVELKILGLHRQIEKGIDCKEVDRMDGHKELVALSVVSSNEYEDDLDKGETLIFTGEGGRNKKTKRQTEDQVLVGGNEALYNSYFRQNPVRVIRHRYDAQGMKKWYIYDGLYKVKDKNKVIGISGKEVWQFKLVREPNQKPLEWSPRVGKASKGQGKQANVIVGREPHEKLRKEVHGKLKEASGDVEGEKIVPKRNEAESEEETSTSETDEDDSLRDSEEKEEGDSSDFEGEKQDFALRRTKRPRGLSEGKKSSRAEENAKPMDVEENYTAMVNQFKHQDMGGKVIFEGGLCQFSNLAKKNRSNVFDKQHGNGDAYQEERSNAMGAILLVPKHKENLNCAKQEGNHDVLRCHQANLMVSEDEDVDIEGGYDSIAEESEDTEFEVEAIIGHRRQIVDGCKQLEYLVCWKEYDVDENSWEPAKNMENASIIVRNYRKQVGLE